MTPDLVVEAPLRTRTLCCFAPDCGRIDSTPAPDDDRELQPSREQTPPFPWMRERRDSKNIVAWARDNPADGAR
jgi:hypothetical protein